MGGAIWRNTLPDKLEKYLPAELKDQAKSIFGSIVVARKYPMHSEARDAINRSYRESQRLLAIAGISSLALMLVVMFFLENIKLDQDDAEGKAKDEGNDFTASVVSAKE